MSRIRNRVRLSILDDLHDSVVKGQHGEASAAVGFGSSVSRDRARKPKAEDVFERGRLSGLFGKARPVSKALGSQRLCLLPDAQSCSSVSGTGAQPLSRFMPTAPCCALM